MLKKLLLFLCLSAVGFNNHSMDADLELDEPQELQELGALLLQEHSLDSAIDKFINKHFNFISYNIVPTLKKIFEVENQSEFKLNSDNIIDKLDQNFIIQEKDYINAAMVNGKRLKQYTNFEHYINNKGMLDLKKFYDHLEQLGFERDAIQNILDTICRHDLKNYIYTDGTCYLQTLIRANTTNDYTKTILDFIQVAPAEELNKQENDGATALHEALYVYERFEDTKCESAQGIFEIIKKLVQHGASPLRENNNKVVPREYSSWKTNEVILLELWKEYENKKFEASRRRNLNALGISSQNRSKQSSIFTTKRLFFGALSLAGIAACCYFGHQYLSKGRETTKLTLRQTF